MRTAKPASERILKLVEVRGPDECWPWLGATTNGYGRIRVGDRRVGAHRVMYERVVGPIPTGLVIDHLCRNRACCNPSHMEPVTSQENTLRGVGLTSRMRISSDRCPSGHMFTAANTIPAWKGSRRCRTCARAQEKASRLRRKASGELAA